MCMCWRLELAVCCECSLTCCVSRDACVRVQSSVDRQTARINEISAAVESERLAIRHGKRKVKKAEEQLVVEKKVHDTTTEARQKPERAQTDSACLGSLCPVPHLFFTHVHSECADRFR